MPALPRPLFFLLLALGAAAFAQPQPDGAPETEAQLRRQAQREQIQTRRKTVEAQRSKEEATCYQQFAVEGCLRDARTKARKADNELRQQELQLNDAERREKATQRLRSIEEKRQEQHEKLQAGERPAPMRGTSRGDAHAREQEARQRAAQQQRHAAEHAADLQRRKAAEPQRISESRSRHEAKQQQARERRERHERQKAEAAASGRKQPAPLPEPGNADRP